MRSPVYLCDNHSLTVSSGPDRSRLGEDGQRSNHITGDELSKFFTINRFFADFSLFQDAKTVTYFLIMYVGLEPVERGPYQQREMSQELWRYHPRDKPMRPGPIKTIATLMYATYRNSHHPYHELGQGPEGTGTCQGDSGSSLQYHNSEEQRFSIFIIVLLLIGLFDEVFVL